MRTGDRVETPHGPGTVLYVRTAPPDYTTLAAVSVRLDARLGDARYTGTIYRADRVKERSA